jgi:hypothetical protein
MKISKNPDLIRRLKFYAFGFGIGLIAVSFIYKGKGCKMPGTLKLEELYSQEIQLTEKVKCKMQCMNINDTALVNALQQGKVNFDESMVRNKPYPFYAVDTDIKSQRIRVMIDDVDAVSRITDIQGISGTKDTCSCN